jgi:hypothetical protein
MKKLILLFCLCFNFIFGSLYAQDFRFRGGLNLSNMRMNYVYSPNANFKIKPNFHVGLTTEFRLFEILSLETGLILSGKGTKFSDEGTGEFNFLDQISVYNFEATLNLLYLDIPFTAKTYFDLGKTKIYGLFGPYLGIGLGGKTKTVMNFNGNEFQTSERAWKLGKSSYKRLDFGLTLGTGLEINSIQIGLTYGLGLANIFNNYYLSNDKAIINNRVLELSLGYRFSRK